MRVSTPAAAAGAARCCYSITSPASTVPPGSSVGRPADSRPPARPGSARWSATRPDRRRPPNRLWLLTSGLGALLALDVVRPSFEFVLGARLNHCWSRLLSWRHDPHADILDRVPCTAQTRSQATALLARLVVVTGRPVAELTAADLLAYRAGVLTVPQADRRARPPVAVPRRARHHRGQPAPGAAPRPEDSHRTRRPLRPGQSTGTQPADRLPHRTVGEHRLLDAALPGHRSVPAVLEADRTDRPWHRHHRSARRRRHGMEANRPLADRPRTVSGCRVAACSER